MLNSSSHLFEIVFEKLSCDTVLSIAHSLGHDVQIPSVEEGVHDSKLVNIVLNGATVREAHFRVLHYELSHYDLELNFYKKDIVADSFEIAQRAIHDYAIKVAEKHQIEKYYGGLEPAADIHTRLFTKNILGPFMLQQ